ncbi:unnamed protein product, partial [Cladocopium goreaui]
ETPLICFQLAANCAQKFPKSAGLASPKDISSAAWASSQLLSMWGDEESLS